MKEMPIKSRKLLVKVSAGSVGDVKRLRALHRSPLDPVRQRELNILAPLVSVVVEGGDGHALGVLVSHGGGSDDLDGSLASTVTSSHVIVHSFDGLSQGRSTVLTVHVVNATARAVLDPNCEILDVSAILLYDLVHVQDLAGSLFHLPLRVHKVPEPGLRHHLIGREHFDAIGWGILLLRDSRVRLGSLTAHNLVQLHLKR
jgi:hypothetical protein